MRPDELERRLQERLDALGPAPRAELLHVVMLPDFERADRIGEFWSYPESRTFAELLIDCEEDRTLRAGAGGHAAGRREAIAARASRGEPPPLPMDQRGDDIRRSTTRRDPDYGLAFMDGK